MVSLPAAPPGCSVTANLPNATGHKEPDQFSSSQTFNLALAKINCKEHLEIKMYGLRGILCILGHTIAFTLRIFVLFLGVLLNFILFLGGHNDRGEGGIER